MRRKKGRFWTKYDNVQQAEPNEVISNLDGSLYAILFNANEGPHSRDLRLVYGSLIDAGVSVQRIRRNIGELMKILPRVKRPLEELTLVATGDVILVFYEETVFEAVSGQEWILDIADIYRDVEKWQKRRRAIKRYRRTKKVYLQQKGRRSG